MHQVSQDSLFPEFDAAAAAPAGPGAPRVVHCKKAPAGSFVYVGRPHPLGNPFALADPGDDAARAVVIERYSRWLHTNAERSARFRARLEKLRGQDLGCWCAPRPCHAQVIIDWLAAHPDPEFAIQMSCEDPSSRETAL